jgi:multiple sugar transport system substrate-binding protein
VLGYTEDQARAALIGGRSNIFIHSSSWVTAMLTSPESKVKETALVTRMPAGPKGDFPASNSQGLGIPKNAKNKEAAWEFIKWALSPEITARIVKDTGHSVDLPPLDHRERRVQAINTINGQDLGKLYLEVLEQPGKTRNYMAYRTVKEFPAGRRRHQQGRGARGLGPDEGGRVDEDGAGARRCDAPAPRRREV